MGPQDLLSEWVAAQGAPAGVEWFEQQCAALADTYTERRLHITFGMIPRRLGKADLLLSEDDLQRAEAARGGWHPSGWSVADAARVLLLLRTTAGSNMSFAERLTDLCQNADVAESVALYRGLAVYPNAETLEPQAGEGLRTNMRTVFEAVAHRNPFPRETFDQDRWNHMVLKALFVDSLLDPIAGLDARANEELARIMCDYAHERWAAGRPVTPEIWRCVGPFATGAMLDDLERAYASENGLEARGAALALHQCPDERAAKILEGRPPMATSVRDGEYTWGDIAAELS